MIGSGSRGFSRFEFVALIAAGLAIAGLLAHFTIEQSIQVERLHALVHRDAVRMAYEDRVLNPEVLRKSANLLDSSDGATLRSCFLDAGRECATKPETCCRRATFSVPLVELGDDAPNFSGTAERPVCWTEEAEVDRVGTRCFAKAFATIEPLCAEGAKTCDKAMAVLIHYHIQLQASFLKPSEAGIQRTLSVGF